MPIPEEATFSTWYITAGGVAGWVEGKETLSEWKVRNSGQIFGPEGGGLRFQIKI